MKYLFIDVGTYSVKFLTMKVDKGKIVPISVESILLTDAMKQVSDSPSVEDVQIHIIKDKLGQNFDGKVIYQIPNEYITSRFIQLPVSNKSKAEMMIPFQLDEQLPFSVHSSHYAASLRKDSGSFKAMVCISKINKFDLFYNKLIQNQILPNILTTELACVNNFVISSKITYPYAILDIGHTTTKVYFIQDGTVVSNHTSYVGGKLIDSFISNTYGLSLEDAISYKQKNCFFLTENQFQKVDRPLKEFAYLMKQMIWPLVKDIQHWELGYRTRYEKRIEQYFIIGGSGNIKNIGHFFSQALKAKVGHLSIDEHYMNIPAKIDQDKSSYSFMTIMSSLERAKQMTLNMLHGKYAASSMNTFPLHSATFIATRTLFIGILLCAFFVGEKIIFLSKKIQNIDRDILNKLKESSLQISQAQRASYRRAPERIFRLLQNKNKDITKEISTLMESSKINAVSPLIQLSKTLGNNENIELVEFYSNAQTMKASLKFQQETALKEVEALLATSPLKEIKSNRMGLMLNLTSSAGGRE